MPPKKKVKIDIDSAYSEIQQALEDQKVPVEKVCDRRKANICDQVTYGYAKRVYDVFSCDNQITSENYPEIPDDITVKKSADKLEKYMIDYIAKDPNDRYAVMKAVFYSNQWQYMMFVSVRMINKFSDILNGMIFLEIVR